VVDDAVVVVHHVFRPDESRQKLDVGTTRPAHACAVGKVLLASGCLPPLRAAQLEPLAARTLVDRPSLLAELAAVRRQHWALDRDELAQGQAGVAAPVRAPGGLVVAAVGLSGDVERLCTTSGSPRPTLLRQVQDCARAVSRELAEA
jgi:DNA-binding IclR family transcriptional regulator